MKRLAKGIYQTVNIYHPFIGENIRVWMWLVKFHNTFKIVFVEGNYLGSARLHLHLNSFFKVVNLYFFITTHSRNINTPFLQTERFFLLRQITMKVKCFRDIWIMSWRNCSKRSSAIWVRDVPKTCSVITCRIHCLQLSKFMKYSVQILLLDRYFVQIFHLSIFHWLFI